MSPDPDRVRFLADECVKLVADDYGRTLDGSVESLIGLDEVCVELLADGPLSDKRLGLWWHLVGGYTGEVVVRAHGGEWVDDDRGGNAPGAVLALGITCFPFNTALRVLQGEDGKSLASFARSLPAIAEFSARKNSGTVPD